MTSPFCGVFLIKSQLYSNIILMSYIIYYILYFFATSLDDLKVPYVCFTGLNYKKIFYVDLDLFNYSLLCTYLFA